MIIDKKIYSKLIKQTKDSKVEKNFLECVEDKKIRHYLVDEYSKKVRSKITIAYGDTFFDKRSRGYVESCENEFFHSEYSPKDEIVTINSKVKKNSVPKSELWLRSLMLKREHEVDYAVPFGLRPDVYTYVYIKNLYKIIELALKIMPNLRKMFVEIQGFFTNESDYKFENFESSVKSDIEKNFEGIMELEKLEKVSIKEEELNNNVQIFEVKYTANKIEKWLTC